MGGGGLVLTRVEDSKGEGVREGKGRRGEERGGEKERKENYKI